MNNDDFSYKFNSSKKGIQRFSSVSIILVAFISAFIGALCAFLIFSNSFNNTSEEVFSSTSQPKDFNLSQVSLTNYSDTAIYAANKVLPSMVSISVEYDVSYFGMKQSASGSGSGIIISSDGYILTNNHVISSADSSSFYEVSDATAIKVSLYKDDKEYAATVVGTDAHTDLAVLKIDKTDLVAAEMGNSSAVQIGEFVLAIGDPYGFERSVTAGIISALNREMTAQNTTYNVIQADCAINSGNSGGALVNSKGQVIGITTLKLAGNGIEGVSFAIPINDATPIYNELIKNGKISRPFVGIYGVDIDEATAIRNNLTKGIYVDSVVKNSPAEQAGIQAGDVIVAIEGQAVFTMDEFNEIKNTKKVGDEIEIKLYRKNEEKSFKVTLGEN